MTNEQRNTRAKKNIVQKQKVRNIHELQTYCPWDTKTKSCTTDGTVPSLFLPTDGLAEIPELAEEWEEMSSEGRAAMNVACQDFGMFFSSCAVYCHLGAMPMNATQAVDLVNHVTGFDYTIREVMELGRRVWYLKRGLSNLFGARAEDDKLPKGMMTPFDSGPTEGSAPDMETMLTEFYELRGFREDGLPKKEILKDLDLADSAELLYR